DGSLNVGSLRIVVLGYDELPMMPEDPYAYVEAAMHEPPPPDFVLKPVYPEFMPPEDDVLPAEEQSLPAAVSPTADLPCYNTDKKVKSKPKGTPASVGLIGNGGDGICCSGDEYDVNGDGGGVVVRYASGRTESAGASNGIGKNGGISYGGVFDSGVSDRGAKM
nr:hypothetical protein [Tanacetum cinerariifolium]